MFIYDNSGQVSQPCEKQVKHISEVRKVTYITTFVNDDKRSSTTKTTQGYEIVKEISVDPTVALITTADIVGEKVVEREIIIKSKKKF